MILYNTLMGVTAGLALILLAVLAGKLGTKKAIAPEGWAISFGVLGIILAVLGGIMSTTWPLTVNQPINILFGEPCMFFGVLLVAAAIFLWNRRELLTKLGESGKAGEEASAYFQRVVTPVSWVIFGLGLVLAACALAIVRFSFIGGAPEAEPITGLLHDYPLIENTFFGIIYALPAIGALLAPLVVHAGFKGGIAKIAFWCMLLAGIAFLLFSAMNYYTHIGLLVNLVEGKNFKY
jgi:hypothetical protein